MIFSFGILPRKFMNGYPKKKSSTFGEWLPSLKLTAKNPCKFMLGRQLPFQWPCFLLVNSLFTDFCSWLFVPGVNIATNGLTEPSTSSGTICICEFRPHIPNSRIRVLLLGDRVHCVHHLYFSITQESVKNPVVTPSSFNMINFCQPSSHVFFWSVFVWSIHENHRSQ